MSDPTPVYTYSATRGNDTDKARELLGATDVSSAETALRSDQVIVAVLAREGFRRGVAWLAANLYAEFAQQPTRLSSSGDLLDFADRLKAWQELASPLRQDLGNNGAEAPPVSTAQIGRIKAGRDAGSKLR